MTVDVEFRGCDKLFEPGDEHVQVIAVPQFLKLAICVVLLVRISERVCEVG